MSAGRSFAPEGLAAPSEFLGPKGTKEAEDLEKTGSSASPHHSNSHGNTPSNQLQRPQNGPRPRREARRVIFHDINFDEGALTYCAGEEPLFLDLMPENHDMAAVFSTHTIRLASGDDNEPALGRAWLSRPWFPELGWCDRILMAFAQAGELSRRCFLLVKWPDTHEWMQFELGSRNQNVF